MTFIKLGRVGRQLRLIDFGTPSSWRTNLITTLTTWLALTSKLLIKYSYSFDVGDGEWDEILCCTCV